MELSSLTRIIAGNSIYQEHLTGQKHPESPARCLAIETALKSANLMTEKNTIVPREANDEEILLCHSKTYLETVKKTISKIHNKLLPDDGYASLPTGDTQISSQSLNVARFAVGGALVGVDTVMQGITETAFCIIRPPGHHAEVEQGMGFCIFNNAAIAARYAQKKYGIKKVAIIDWDVHHGNGTQAIFERDPSVFYFSTHRTRFYPGTGDKSDVGLENGIGTTLNCPILKSGTSPRLEVLKAFREKLVPAMKNFQPELIIISAGFDAHKNDPLGGFDLEDKDFAELTRIVKNIAAKYAKGRIVSILEGGYDLEAIGSAAKSHVLALSKSISFDSNPSSWKMWLLKFWNSFLI